MKKQNVIILGDVDIKMGKTLQQMNHILIMKRFNESKKIPGLGTTDLQASLVHDPIPWQDQLITPKKKA